MCYGNSVSWSDGGSWSSKSHKSSDSWKSYLVCDGCHNWVHEHRAQKKTASCAKVVARRSSQQDLTANAELFLAQEAGGCFDFNAAVSASLNLLSKNPQTGLLAQVLEEARRNYVLPAHGYPPLADHESFRHFTTTVDKSGQRTRNIEKKRAVVAKVELARKSAEQNRGANEKTLAHARSHFHKTQQDRCLLRGGRGECSSSKQQGRQR